MDQLHPGADGYFSINAVFIVSSVFLLLLAEFIPAIPIVVIIEFVFCRQRKFFIDLT